MITVDFNRLAIQPGYRILDIGCGSGRHTCAALQCKNVLAVGVDINFDDVIEADNRIEYHAKFGNHGGGTGVISVADTLDLPFKDNFFDFVICSEVLEHIHDHRTAVSEIIRVLKPGRNLMVSVPRYLPERICWTFSKDYRNTANGHIRIYKQKELTELLETTGATLWGKHYAHSLHTPYWWLKCLLGPAREDLRLVNLYHRFLVWDMMKHPWITRLLENLLNPLLGKSLVLYLRKA
ncbi:MAG: class I SAM-dependent methyltransferase [Candidatus Desulfatibia sp.]|uniref:class I SAM-dependent methyltransferase n=1 Tax=Candidatus Desulfatibia sp. TaxID=3101189 RepID=UPI002F2FE52F